MVKLLLTGAVRFASAWVTGGVLRLLVRVLDRQAEARTEALDDLESDLHLAALVLARMAGDSGNRTSLDDVVASFGFTREEIDAAGTVEAELAGFLRGAESANQLEWE